MVYGLSDADSQAAHEEDGGGVMTTVFADPKGGSNPARVIGDLNRDNFDAEWSQIRYGGSTFGKPGVDLVVDKYMTEFGGRSKMNRPVLGLAITTDGELRDSDEFVRTINEELGGSAKVVISVYGYGDDHRVAVDSYRMLEAAHSDSIRVLEVPPGTNPRLVADTMRTLLGLN